MYAINALMHTIEEMLPIILTLISRLWQHHIVAHIANMASSYRITMVATSNGLCCLTTYSFMMYIKCCPLLSHLVFSHTDRHTLT